MITFDFNNDGTQARDSSFGANNDTAVNVADGVRFTITSDGPGGMIFWNGVPNTGDGNIRLDQKTTSGTATFVLDFTTTGNGSTRTIIEGTDSSRIVLDLGSVSGGAGNGFEGGDLQVTFLGANGFDDVVRNVVNGTEDLTVVGEYSGIRFTISGPRGDLNITDLTVKSLFCFCAGTRIETADGPQAIEDLRKGDVLRTADGGLTSVHWLGQQTVHTRISDPAKVNPICISAGAIAPGVPARDLWLSRDHAVEIGGVLYTAGSLVNGDTIYQVADMPAMFIYYHVETDGHDLLLAEGLSAETYVDYLTEGLFDTPRAPRVIAEMGLPRVSSARMVPADVRRQLTRCVAA